MNENFDRLISSFEIESRYYVINCSVFIEKSISETIGRLLEIEWEKSETLGYGSSSMGFDNKVRLIQDLKGIDKESRKQFQCFMTIRNKFAHIAEIDTFEKYYNLISSSKERKKELIKWFPNINWKGQDIEVVNKFAYFCLTLELINVLFKIDMAYSYEKGQKHGKNKYYEKFIDVTKSKLEDLENGKEILRSIYESIK